MSELLLFPKEQSLDNFKLFWILIGEEFWHMRLK